MLNIKATPCEKSKAIVLVGEGRLGFNNKFMDDLEESRYTARTIKWCTKCRHTSRSKTWLAGIIG